MTPLLLLALAASTTPATINHTPTTSTERSTTIMAIPYPERHPNSGPVRGPGTTFNRIGRDANNPQRANHGYPQMGHNPIAATTTTIIPDERTNRPTGMGG